MSDEITITLSKESLAGVYYLAEMGILSAELNERIKDVVLKSEEGSDIKDYYKIKDQWSNVLRDAVSIGVKTETPEGTQIKTSIAMAFPALDQILTELQKAFGNSSEETEDL